MSPSSPSSLIAPRLALAGDDPIFALNAQAQRRSAAGEDIVNSTLGVLLDEEGRLCTLPAVLDAYRRIPPQDAAGYAPIAGTKAFRDAVREDVFQGSALLPHSVAVATPGGSGALALAVGSFLEPGQSLLTTSFYWSPYDTIAAVSDRAIATFSMFDDGGRFDAGALAEGLQAQMAAQGRALLVLNTPCHNPTGYSLDEQDWVGVRAAVKAAAAKGPVTVLMDIAYAHFAAPGGADWVRELEPVAQDCTIAVAWSASKAFAQYGARVGALLVVEPDAERRKQVEGALAAGCRGTWSNCNHMGMQAVTACLVDPELAPQAKEQRAALRDLLGARVQAFVQRCADLDIAHPRYEGGFFVTAPCRDPELAAMRMREQGVFVVPVQGALRVALCSTPARSIERLCAAMASALAAGG